MRGKTFACVAVVIVVIFGASCTDPNDQGNDALDSPAITAVVGGLGQASVFWEAVDGATTYDVYWCAGSTINVASAAHVANTSSPCLIGGVSNGSSYSFLVKASDAKGRTAVSPAFTKVMPTVQVIGTAGFSAADAPLVSFAFGNGVPYIAYGDQQVGYAVTVKKFNGIGWTTVGTQGFAQPLGLDLTTWNGAPCVVFGDKSNGNKATVMKYNGAGWVTVGNACFSAGHAQYPAVAVDSAGTPYVSYEDIANSSKATVMKLSGTTWGPVGSPGFSAGTADHTDVTLCNGIPYVSCDGKIKVFNGSSWVAVGSNCPSPTPSYRAFTFDSHGAAYVAFYDATAGGKLSVMRYDGSTWSYVGAPGFSGDPIQIEHISLAVDAVGTVYVAYQDYFGEFRIVLMQYLGGAWSEIGADGLPGGVGFVPSIALDPNGSPYVAFTDSANGNKATVIAFK